MTIYFKGKYSDFVFAAKEKAVNETEGTFIGLCLGLESEHRRMCTYSLSSVEEISYGEACRKVHGPLIHSWVDGAEIETYDSMAGKWIDCPDPCWAAESLYRIKYVPPAPIVNYMFVEARPTLDNAYDKPNLKLTFDGETHKLLKAEIINE